MSSWTEPQIIIAGVQTVGSVALLVVTLFILKANAKAADATKQSVDQVKRIHLNESAPYLIASFEVGNGNFHAIYFKIKNIGKTAAKNVKLEFNPDMEEIFNNDSFIAGLKKGIPTMPPGFELQSFLETYMKIVDKNMERMFEVRIMYLNNEGDEFTQVYFLDIGVFHGLTLLTNSSNEMSGLIKANKETSKILKKNLTNSNFRPVLRDISDSLEKISRAIAPEDDAAQAEEEVVEDHSEEEQKEVISRYMSRR